MTVWVVHISHKHGNDYSVYDSEEAADASAYQYVFEWWDDTGPGRDGETIPDDPEIAVTQYFEDHPSEWLSIATAYVRTDIDRLAEKSLI